MKTPSPPPSAPPAESGGDVIELSRFRAELGRGRRLRRGDTLLESEDPKGAVRALPGDELYYVIHELGFPDANEILQYATPAQVQTSLDFALWDRDQLAPAALDEWLTAMVEAPPEAVGAWARNLDVELLALLLRRRARIYDVSLEEPPEEAEGTLYSTPDRLFVLDLAGDDEDQQVTMRFVDALYQKDIEWTRRIMVGTRGDLDSELEEHAYRWRSGRMADLGFEDYYSALEVYRELDPASVRLGDTPIGRVRPLGDEADRGSSLRVPGALTERLGAGSTFARALGGISDRDELANIQASLTTLSNRVLAADRITPGDDVAVAAVLGRLLATLDLAVEFLARGRTEDAVRAVRTVPLMRLFQLGVSVIGKVRRLASTLLKKNPFARLRPEIDLFESEDAEVLTACTRMRPLFPLRLDDPNATGERPFGSLADVARATAAVERAGAAIALLMALGVRPEQLESPAREALGIIEPDAIDAGLLGRTLVARSWLDAPVTLTPPDAALTAKLKQNLKKASQDPAFVVDSRKRLLELAAPILAIAAAPAVLGRWFDQLLAGEPVLGSADAEGRGGG